MDGNSKRKRVLFLCRAIPWPLDGGVAVRNYWFLKSLSSEYDIDLVVPVSWAEVPDEINRLCAEVFTFPRPVIPNVTRGLEILRTHSYLLAGQMSSIRCRQVVSRLLKERDYAFVQVEELMQMTILPRTVNAPIVYDAHNCESALRRRHASLEAAVPRSLLLWDTHQIEAYEREVLRRASLVLVTSEVDAKELGDLEPECSTNIQVLPNGADVASYADIRKTVGDPGRILITGSMDWRPNYLGLKWFLDDVIPVMHEVFNRSPFPSIRVAGRMTANTAKEIESVIGTFAIPNPVSMHEELTRANLIVIPVRASSGTRVRILEAWSCARPVITTAAGAFGLPVTSGNELMIADDAMEFAKAIKLVLDTATLQDWLARSGWNVVQHYDWSVIGRKLLSVCGELVAPAGGAKS